MKNDMLVGKTIDTKKEVFIKENDRLSNTLILGGIANGTLSLSIKPAILNDILYGECSTVFFDPIGDLAQDVYNIATARYRHPIYICPNNTNIAINPLAKDEQTVIKQLVNVFNNIYFQDDFYFKNQCIELLTNSIKVVKRVYGNKATFSELDILINNTDNKGEEILLDLVNKSFTSDNLNLASWFAHYYEHNLMSNDYFTTKQFVSIYAKDKTLSDIFNNPNKRNVDIEKVINEGKHLIVGGFSSILKKERGLALSLLILEQVMTALDKRENYYRPTFMYLNNINEYLTEDIVDLLTYNRSLNVGVIVNVESRLLIADKYKNKLFSNIRNLIIYPGLGAKDSQYYSDMFTYYIKNKDKSHVKTEDFSQDNLTYKPFKQFSTLLLKDNDYTLPTTLEGIFFE